MNFYWFQRKEYELLVYANSEDEAELIAQKAKRINWILIYSQADLSHCPELKIETNNFCGYFHLENFKTAPTFSDFQNTFKLVCRKEKIKKLFE